MIYPCPHCKVTLELQSVHFGKEIACPECGERFTTEELPPVTVVHREKKEIEFFHVFKTVVYIFISVLLIGAVCWGGYCLVKRNYPTLFKDDKPEPVPPTVDEVISAFNQKIPEKTVIYVKEPAETLPEVQKRVYEDDVEKKNREAEQKFLKDLDKPEKK